MPVADHITRVPIPLARPDIGPLELEYVTRVLSGATLAMGPFTAQFEAGIAGLTGRREGVACSSGTAGLHMAVRALDLRAGDEVITTSFSFVASANCLLYERVVPRFVDIEDDSLGLDPDLIAGAGTVRTRAVLPVHVFGRPCRIESIDQITRGSGWRMIEDSCEGLGSSVSGRALGSFGDVSVFAFYPNKQITTGEGGMAVTDDIGLAEIMRSLRNQGRDADGTWLRHVRLGYNYRMDEMSAALGLAQLQRLASLQAGRARVAAAYARELGGYGSVSLPAVGPDEVVDWFVFVLRLNPDIDRDRLIGQLSAVGVPSRPYFAPIHLQPYYRATFGYKEGDLPVTERVAASTLAIPFSSQLTDAQVATVAVAIREAINEQGRV